MIAVELGLSALVDTAPGEAARDAWALLSGYDFRASDRAALLSSSLRWLIGELKSERCACRKLRPCWSGGLGVLVQSTAQSLASADVQVADLGLVGDRWWQRV